MLTRTVVASLLRILNLVDSDADEVDHATRAALLAGMFELVGYLVPWPLCELFARWAPCLWRYARGEDLDLADAGCLSELGFPLSGSVSRLR